MLRVGYYQFRPIFGQPGENTKKVVEKLIKVSADIIVLPELAFTGYYFKDRDELKSLSEDLDKSSTYLIISSKLLAFSFRIIIIHS